MPIDCNKHCSDEQNIICGLQNQLAKLEIQQTLRQTPEQQKSLDTAIDKLKDDIQNAVVDHKTCITACELRTRSCDGGGGGNRKKYSKSRRFRTRRRVRRIRRGRTKNTRST